MNFTRLTYCPHNYKAKIVEFDGGTGARENIESHGLNIGDEVLFKSRENGRGKIIVEHHNKEIRLGHELASKILLECDDYTTTLDYVQVGDVVEVTKMAA
ncbi:MAG: FeoA family protein, partial [Melioribacteraceae bacterium]|nr:FeoA family protein [Melioribacteraceae bacterium]